MYFHIGNSIIVFNSELVGIFNLIQVENKINKGFLESTSNNIVHLQSTQERPKSFIVTDSCVYMSPISPYTLSRRQKKSFQPRCNRNNNSKTWYN